MKGEKAMKFERDYANGELVGYKCEKGYIERNCCNITFSGNYHYDYRITKSDVPLKATSFETLKEAKEALLRA